jgi:hypothetical protein
VRLTRYSKIWTTVVIVAMTVQAVACLAVPRGYVLTTITDLLCALLIISTLAAFAVNAANSTGRLRLFWILQACGWAFWLVDQGFWIAYDVVLQKAVPTFFEADILLFLAGAPMLAGLLLRPHLQS